VIKNAVETWQAYNTWAIDGLNRYPAAAAS
jgi:cell division protein YceG involved in septum cleavage